MAKKLPFNSSDMAFAKAFNAGDVAKVAAIYGKDAIFMMPEAPAYKGTKGVRAVNQAMIEEQRRRG